MSIRSLLMVISFVLSILIGLIISQNQVTPPSNRDNQIVIGLSLDTLKEARWQKDRDIFVSYAKELGADVLVQAANSDDTTQMQNIEALISRRVDVLVIVPHNGKAMAKAVEKAHEAGIPVIAYDRIIQDCDVDVYISFDNVKVGEMQATFLLDSLSNHGKIIRIYGSKTDNNAFLFKKGQDNILEPYIKKGMIEVIHEDWAEDWKPENGKKITNAAISLHGENFTAVLAANDGTAGGAIQALTEEGLAGKIMVIGQDAELVACQRIVQGTQSMTIYKPLKKLAQRAARLAIDMAKRKVIVAQESTDNGKINVPTIAIDVQAVTKKNMEQTIIKDGFHDRKDIFNE
ncbi:sugar ABC transporter substrate-binding protein [Candidatus Uabimicrobium sp. HlEnr_7]|uniref:sugar ABC transporter substrate-binding protein n=1 Tax=Candidatus Uabimicrobium helgolandensis TaxID=3095367 RepID=UPI0035589291